MTRLIVDTREKPRAITGILDTFDRKGIEVVRRALPFGDYRDPDWRDLEGHPIKHPGLLEPVVDRKQNLSEVCCNLIQQRARFLREVERANKAGCHLIVLVEHSNRIRKLEDVINWVNPRLKVSPYAVPGERLFKIMKATAEHHGFSWACCDKRHTGEMIIELLQEPVLPF